MKIFQYGHRQIEKDDCLICRDFVDNCFVSVDKKYKRIIVIPINRINSLHKNIFYSFNKFSTNQFIKFDRKRFK